MYIMIYCIKKLYPLMNVDDVYGCLYSPGDGTIDPHGLCTALARYATRQGAKVTQLPFCFHFEETFHNFWRNLKILVHTYSTLFCI